MSKLSTNTTSLQEILAAVNALPEASTGVELPELANPGSASDLLNGKELIDQEGNIVTGTIATKTSSNLTVSGATVTVPAGYYASNASKSVATATQATPSVSIDANGKITATATQTAGYVSAGTKTGTKQLTTQAAQTITPKTSDQTIASGRYLTGVQTIKGDANLIPANIINGKSIFGVTGTASIGVELPELTNPANNDEVFLGKEIYDIDGNVRTGTFTIESELTTQNDLIAQLQNAVNDLPDANTGGVELPTLSNPATSDEILDGYEAIDGDGNIIAGTHVCEGGSDLGYGSFTVFNPTDLFFAINGLMCPPGESTTVPISNCGPQLFFLQNFDGWTIEHMGFEYDVEYDDGIVNTESSSVYCPNLDNGDFILCGYCDISDDCTFIATYS